MRGESMEIEQEEFKVHPSGVLSPCWIAPVLPWQETQTLLCCLCNRALVPPHARV